MADASTEIVTRSALITPRLGLVFVQGAELAAVKVLNNSTRWIFDIEHFSDDVTIQLLECRSGKDIHPDVLSLGLLPRSSNFYRVQPIVSEILGGKFVLRGSGMPHVSCAFRVQIDAMHTATR